MPDEKMTNKQRSCINFICGILHMNYSGLDTKSDAWFFIKKYKSLADQVFQEVKYVESADFFERGY